MISQSDVETIKKAKNEKDYETMLFEMLEKEYTDSQPKTKKERKSGK